MQREGQAEPRRAGPQSAVAALVHAAFVPALLLVLTAASACDTRKDTLSDPLATFLCVSSATCAHGRNTAFGLLGDSWTDLALGQPLIRDLRDYVEEDYGFRLTAATLAGQKLATVLHTGLHFEVIRRGGPSLRWMIVSLGGNDLVFNATRYTADPAAERARVLAGIERDLLELVRTGNAFRRSEFGGEPIVWFVHGYDFGNPDNVFTTTAFTSDTGCRARLRISGYSDALIDTELPRNLDAYHDMLVRAAAQEATLRNIDLRRTLGGPPVTPPSLMFDCIHPNTIGFGSLSAVLVRAIDATTGGAR